MANFATDLRRSLIRAVPGSGHPLRVNPDQGLALATVDLDSWRASYDLATDDLLCSPVGDDEALFAASDRLEAVRAELNAAVKRYRRAMAARRDRSRRAKGGRLMPNIRHGDNADVMRAMLEAGERFTLAYLDPPFFTGRDFETTDGQAAYSDKWASFDEYLTSVMARAALAYQLLEPHGSIVVHLDPTVSHYVKVAGDVLFGRHNFLSEIIWRYRRWPTPTKNFQAMHDVLLRWGTGAAEPRFNQLFEPLSATTIAAFGEEKQRHARIQGERVPARRVQSTGELSQGAAMADVWDISIVAPSGDERTGYPTQKPEALIERLVLALTNEGDRVLSPYMGSGTELAVCHRLGRKATGIDSSEVAINVARERMAPLEAQGNLFASKEAV